MREAIVADEVLLEGVLRSGMAVLVEAGMIADIMPAQELPESISRRNVSGLLTPGFIDIHTHGAFGVSFGEGPADRTRVALEKLLQRGITTVLPTTPSLSLQALGMAVDSIASVPDAADLPRIPGMHLEGPYFSVAQRGAQMEEVLRVPDDGSIREILRHAEHISMMSFAPELPGAVELTQALREHGIVAAAGHSDGTSEDLWACQEAGLSHVIHIVSGQSVTKRVGPWRVPGMFEATLASDNLSVELIADGKHLPRELMVLAHRCLAGRLCAVSDATPGAGLAEGEHFTMGPGEYVVSRGVAMTLDGTAFGGSTTTLNEMLPILRSNIDLSIPEVLEMVTHIPARAAHLERLGSIRPGYHADFVTLDGDLLVTGVARAGVWLEGTRDTTR